MFVTVLRTDIRCICYRIANHRNTSFSQSAILYEYLFWCFSAQYRVPYQYACVMFRNPSRARGVHNTVILANSRLLHFVRDNRRWTMAITQANYLIALRLIHSLSRFIPQKLIRRIIRWLIRISFSLSLHVQASFLPYISPRLPPPLHRNGIQSVVNVPTRPSFICIQTATVNKPFLVVADAATFCSPITWFPVTWSASSIRIAYIKSDSFMRGRW